MDARELERENAALNEQIKLLVKTERRLYGAQRVIEQQLLHFQALNRLTLEAARAGDPERILSVALETLTDLFDIDQGIALFANERGDLGVAALRTQDGCEALRDAGWVPQAWPAPSLSAPLLLEDRQPAPALDPALRELLDEIARRLVCAAEAGAQVGALAAIEAVVPLKRRDGRTLGLLVLHKLDRATSYHEVLIGEADLPFLALVGTHVETALQNVILYRQVRSFAAHLEDKIAARTADLARANRELARGLRRLQETQEKLIQSGRTAAVLTLVAGLSHELNNPIGIIIGYAQLLSGEIPADSPWARPIAAIDRHARRCGRLIGALLEFAREGPIVRQSSAVEPIVRAAAGRVEAVAAQHDVRLCVDAAEADLPALFVNAGEIEAALVAVLGNAVDASPRGATVWLRARPRRRGGQQGVELCVRDTGSGIAAEVLPRIFDPFFTTKPVGGGTGLGLPLAHQTIESHGGRIEVQSAPARGTTVVIWLPAGEVATRGEAQRAGDAR
jgi:signal transduction histidine kinase